jgi:hypothetical protein
MATTSPVPPATVSNPFPVYPVSSLRDIAPDILTRTVPTDAVRTIDAAIKGYVKRAAHGARAGLTIPVRGDYGTGKTHVLVFAQALLKDSWPGGARR